MSEAYMGEIRAFATSKVPPGWMKCEGQALPIPQYQALYGLLGDAYGPAPANKFNLPDLRGRVPIGVGTLHDGSVARGTYVLGGTGGIDMVPLSAANLPVHRHDMIASSAAASSQVLAGGILADTSKVTSIYDADGDGTVQLASISVGQGGGGQKPKSNMQPYLTSAYCICITGIFPPRG